MSIVSIVMEMVGNPDYYPILYARRNVTNAEDCNDDDQILSRCCRIGLNDTRADAAKMGLEVMINI